MPDHREVPPYKRRRCPHCGGIVEPERPMELVHAIAEDGRYHGEIAEAARVSRSYLGGVLSGRITPSPMLRRRIAHALGLPVERLFPAGPDEAPAARKARAS
jgi:transcriptional regulator with XRE-family HTH domain